MTDIKVEQMMGMENAYELHCSEHAQDLDVHIGRENGTTQSIKSFVNMHLPNPPVTLCDDG